MMSVDIRLKAVLLTMALVIAVVLSVNFWPETMHQQPADGVDLSPKLHTASLFNAAVNDLRQRHYQQAIDGFQALLKITPGMPEAYVNIGFARLEQKQYVLARQAFNTALDLRKGQHNAYWGLAVSLEGLCDISAATGAMKTFVHLAKPDDPYLKKANAALWEWAQLKKVAEQRGDNRIVCQ